MESSNQLLKIAINGACNWQFIIYLISFPFSIDENWFRINKFTLQLYCPCIAIWKKASLYRDPGRVKIDILLHGMEVLRQQNICSQI